MIINQQHYKSKFPIIKKREITFLFSVKIYIPKYFNLYNNNLYTNIVSDERNKVDIECTILSNDYTIEPGDRLYTVKSEREPDSVDLTISYKILLFEKRQSYTIPVYTVY